MNDQHLSWDGIQLIWVVLGILGAAVGINNMPPMSKRQCWSALCSGVIFAGYGPQWVDYAYVHWTPDWFNATHGDLPSFMLGSIAFVCGVGGLFLVPGIMTFWKDPRGTFLAFWRALVEVRTGRRDDGGAQ